jgi:hypothetical protein
MARHRWILAGTLAAALTAAPGPSARAEQEGLEDWAGTVLEGIRRAEYAFSVREDRSWSAPNRAHGLRIRIDATGLEVTSRVHGDWTLRLTPQAWRGSQEAAPEARGNRVDRTRGDLREWYVNDERGLAQVFMIEAPPEGTPAPVLEMVLSGDLLAYPTGDRRAVRFETAGGEAVLQYTGLLATDALGANVPASLTVEPGRLRIVLQDDSAVYPLTVDALMSSPTWMDNGTQAGELFGLSVATAGDVNGDGTSDVVVGAPGFDNGHGPVGRALLYLGSPSGPSTTPDWIVTGDQPGEALGFSVSTAGDVNRDGYDDLLVGAAGYDSGPISRAGAAFVWHGSAEGLGEDTTPASADWRMEGDRPGNETQAAYAGDLNGDLYDDIVIGMDGYANGQITEGAAFVFFGSAAGLGPNGTPSNADWRVEGDQAGAGLGHAVGSAGDVDRDGYEDLIVGAPGYDNGHDGEGAAFVFLGSATGLGSNGTPANADWRSEGNQPAANFGISVALAGDVNGDGYGDILVGCDACASGQTGEGRAFLHLGSASGPGIAAAWTAESNQASSAFGRSVSTAGDANGDGYADVLVGAPSYDNGETGEGAAFVWYGSVSGLGLSGTPANADWTAEGGQPTATLGMSVAPAGDVNGDGLGDVILGAFGFDASPGGNEGAAWVYPGSASGLASQATWATVGPQADGGFGETVASAGDVDGDGYSDVLVGVVRYDNGQTDEGAVFLYRGTSGGLASFVAWSAEGDQAGAMLGSSVASAGDVNGDGYSDVIVGASGYVVGGATVGGAFVWHGSATGLGANGTPANADWSVTGSTSASGLTIRGKSAASAGDVNGDGYAEVIVGGTFVPSAEPAYGMVFLYRGSPGGLEASSVHTLSANATSFGAAVASAGDVNADGFGDVLIGSAAESFGQTGEGMAFVCLGSGGILMCGWHAEADQAGAGLGISVSSAGDVNGDGYSDVLVGASAYDHGETDEGSAFVWYGGPAGLGPNGNPGNADWWVESDQAGALFGKSVSAAGDVDADGYGDVLVGAPAYETGQIDEGAAFAYRGSASGLGTSPAWTEERDQVGAQFGLMVAMAGDVDGDGYGDVLVGAPAYDSQGIDRGLAVIHLGNGVHGRDRIPRQARADGTAPIAILGRSESETLFRLRARGRTPAGRKNIVLEYEIKPLGYPLDGTGLGFSANVSPVCSASGCHVDFDELPLFSGILSATHYHWRLRTSTFSPLFPRTPWVSLPGNGRTETDLRTAGCRDLDGDGYGSPPDTACGTGPELDCDDSLATVYPGAIELCDGRDNDCDHVVDDVLAPAGSPVLTGLKLETGTSLTWTEMADATAYDVVWGNLVVLRGGLGNFTTATTACLANDHPANVVEVADVPPVGAGSWYLVRSVNCAGVGTYDSGAPSQVAPRDAEIAAASSTCP